MVKEGHDTGGGSHNPSVGEGEAGLKGTLEEDGLTSPLRLRLGSGNKWARGRGEEEGREGEI